MDKQLCKALSIVIGKTLHGVVLHPVRLELIWSDITNELENMDEIEDGNDDNDDNDDNDNDAPTIQVDEELKEKIKNENWNWVPFPNIKKATGRSLKTGNHDRRGGGCGDHEFPVKEFVWKVENPSGVTLKQYTEIVYRLKGSKYDLWYELYEDCDKWEFNDDTLTFKANFGYGS
jgi:hypothetical protein